MSAWRAVGRLLSGWAVLLAGVLILLDSNLPRSLAPDRFRGPQALAGFGLVVAGWWLRRRALRPPENPK